MRTKINKTNPIGKRLSTPRFIKSHDEKQNACSWGILTSITYTRKNTERFWKSPFKHSAVWIDATRGKYNIIAANWITTFLAELHRDAGTLFAPCEAFNKMSGALWVYCAVAYWDRGFDWNCCCAIVCCCLLTIKTIASISIYARDDPNAFVEV